VVPATAFFQVLTDSDSEGDSCNPPAPPLPPVIGPNPANENGSSDVMSYVSPLTTTTGGNEYAGSSLTALMDSQFPRKQSNSDSHLKAASASSKHSIYLAQATPSRESDLAPTFSSHPPPFAPALPSLAVSNPPLIMPPQQYPFQFNTTIYGPHQAPAGAHPNPSVSNLLSGTQIPAAASGTYDSSSGANHVFLSFE
ncbi:unnamed protein product, partial [Protopolystoma xenopodis]